MTTIFDSARPVKSESFGRGIDRERLAYPEPSDEDRTWAAAEFDRLDRERYLAEKNRWLDEQAEQAQWDDQFRIPPGICEICGEASDWLDRVHKICGPCDTAATNASIACMNNPAMGQYRVF
jgi:hypothetical protein